MAPKPVEFNENGRKRKGRKSEEFMYFHTILNSLLHLLEHILYSYNHECISSTLLSTNAFWLIYPVFTALHMNATCMVWQAHAM